MLMEELSWLKWAITHLGRLEYDVLIPHFKVKI